MTDGEVFLQRDSSLGVQSLEDRSTRFGECERSPRISTKPSQLYELSCFRCEKQITNPEARTVLPFHSRRTQRRAQSRPLNCLLTSPRSDQRRRLESPLWTQ